MAPRLLAVSMLLEAQRPGLQLWKGARLGATSAQRVQQSALRCDGLADWLLSVSQLAGPFEIVS